VSPTTRARDRKLKAERYATLGVAHYWIVDPIRKTLECYWLRSGHYTPVTAAQASVDLTHPDWPGMTIDLGAIWR
jgi:Uma2 family endonuclease